MLSSVFQVTIFMGEPTDSKDTWLASATQLIAELGWTPALQPRTHISNQHTVASVMSNKLVSETSIFWQPSGSYNFWKKFKYNCFYFIKTHKICDHLEIQRLLTWLNQENINFFPLLYIDITVGKTQII